MRQFILRLINTFRPKTADGDLAREVAAHLALLEDEYRRRGLTPDEARLAARRAIGSVAQMKDLHRDVALVRVARRPAARSAACRPDALARSRIHDGRSADSGARHRFDHRSLQRRQWCAPEAIAVSGARSPGASVRSYAHHRGHRWPADAAGRSALADLRATAVG